MLRRNITHTWGPTWSFLTNLSGLVKLYDNVAQLIKYNVFKLYFVCFMYKDRPYQICILSRL